MDFRDAYVRILSLIIYSIHLVAVKAEIRTFDTSIKMASLHTDINWTVTLHVQDLKI